MAKTGTLCLTAALLAGGLLAGCSMAAPEPDAEPVVEPVTEPKLSSFGSIDEAYEAVAGILDCEPDSTAEPVTLMFDGYLPEYRMCSEAVQIVRYENEADRGKAAGLLAGAENRPEHFAEGSNWHVIVLPRGGAEQVPGEKEIADLAGRLGGRYVSAEPG